MFASTETRPRRISEFAVSAVQEHFARNGIDGFVVADFCEYEGISRPTFYSRFGNVEGLVAELWIEDGRRWLDCLVARDFSMTPQDIGMALVLAFAHRNSEVAEVVIADIRTWWSDKSTAMLPESIAWLVANRIGVLLTADSVPEVSAAMLLDGPILAIAEKIDKLDPEPIPDLDLAGLEFDDGILEAGCRVIGNVGYRNASMTRIARAANFTTGALYPHFVNVTDVYSTVYRFAQQQIVTSNTRIWNQHGLSIESFGSFVHCGLDAKRKSWRQLRTETFIAARPESEIAELARESLAAMVGSVMTAVDAAGVREPMRSAVPYLFHTLGLGLAVLESLELPVATINHVGMTRQLVHFVVSQ